MRNESGAWHLTPEAFEALLAAFHADREEAALLYDGLRERLISFFSRQGLVQSESLADEVLDRMARRASTGVRIDSLSSYAYGVARFVIQEERRRTAREDAVHKTYVENVLASLDTQSDRDMREAMQTCLDRQSEGDRELLTQYYAFRGQMKIKRRRELARKLNLTPEALRKHTFNLRRAIEGCVRARMTGKAGTGKNG